MNGVTYTYHMPSGQRLPNLPFDDRRFLAAYDQARFAHETGTESVERWGLRETPMEYGSFELRRTPHAVAFTVLDMVRFAVTASADQVVIYHSGNLALDAASDALLRDKQRYVQIAKDFGLLHLQQSRVEEGCYQYFAIRTDGALRNLPQNVLMGRITPDEYTALHAVNERQASLSVSRVIRDTLTLTDAEAGEWRGNMIRRGWLTNGRPPELTALGLSLLS